VVIVGIEPGTFIEYQVSMLTTRPVEQCSSHWHKTTYIWNLFDTIKLMN